MNITQDFALPELASTVPALVFTISAVFILFISMFSLMVDKGRIGLALLVAGIIIAVPGVIMAVNHSQELKKSKTLVIEEIERTYNIEFYNNSLEKEIRTLIKGNPDNKSVPVEAVIYTHEDKVYSSDIMIMHNSSTKGNTIALYSNSSGATEMTPFNPAEGTESLEPLNSDSE